MEKINLEKNNLESSESLYLKQHRNDLVNWQIYDTEVLEQAKEKNKLIFVSIGYSACHWCHKQQKESFNNEKIAQILNQEFISIKIDREENPLIDNYFQKALQSFSSNGGWPVSAFLNSNFELFFIGTYFPPFGQNQQLGFYELLNQILDTFEQEPDTIKTNIEKFSEALTYNLLPNKEIKFPGQFPASEGVLNAIKDLKDEVNGGYADKPKFPQYSFYAWGIEQTMEQVVSSESANHLLYTVDRIAESSMVDQVRGGVHRYSVDAHWTVPHFEKMLYDQAGFLQLMALTSSIQPTPLILDNILSTIDYLEKEMLAEEKYFFTSQDADSEGEEGLYYSFTEEEIKEIFSTHELTKELDYKVFEDRFDFSSEGNYQNGLNTIKLKKIEDPEVVFEQNYWDQIRKFKTALKNERAQRIPPGTDTKGLANWNFMLLSSLLDIIQYCPIDAIKERAQQLFIFSKPEIVKTFIQDIDNKTIVSHSTLPNSISNFLEDYVFAMELFFKTYEILGSSEDLTRAYQLASIILNDFYADNNFYQAKHGSQNNIQARFYDQSYRSAVSTYLFYIRKYSFVHEEMAKIKSNLKDFIAEYPYIVLNSPLGFAMGVKAMCYPDEAFKICYIPQDFLQDQKFINFRRVLTSRFVFVFESKIEGKQNWKICHLNECIHDGSGIDNFIQTFIRKKEDGK